MGDIAYNEKLGVITRTPKDVLGDDATAKVMKLLSDKQECIMLAKALHKACRFFGRMHEINPKAVRVGLEDIKRIDEFKASLMISDIYADITTSNLQNTSNGKYSNI